MNGQRRGPYRHSARRRQEILESATRIFGRYGSDSSLRRVAADVGMTPAGVLRHFESKEALLQAVVEYADVERGDRPPTEAADGLEFFTLQLSRLEQYPVDSESTELLITLTAEASDPSHPAQSVLLQRHERLVAAGIRNLRIARERGDIRPLDDAEVETDVRAVFAIMDGLSLQRLLDRSLDFGSIFRRYLAVMLKDWTPAER